MRLDRLPLTYEECRARLRFVAARQGLAVESHPIAAPGPDGQTLSVDVVQIGAPHPDRVFVALSGVHGVEGFIGSALQCDLIGRTDPTRLPADLAVVLVHAVNPWGMAWWRRQNESNVDLNRNWRRDDADPPHNAAYDGLHPLACPDGDAPPTAEELLVAATQLIDARGLPYVRDGITVGQYAHPDGLHYGGVRTEESNRILERVVQDRLAGAARVFTMDLHTGHGPRGVVTSLSNTAPGSAQDRFLREVVAVDRVEATEANPEATTATKVGQIANGFAQMLPGAECFATTVEFGTEPDEVQLIVTCRELWVHRHGDRAIPEHAAAVWDYRCCFTPDDPEWEAQALRDGARHLDAGVAAVAAWA